MQAATARDARKEEGGTKSSFAPPHNDVRFRKPSPPPPNDHVGRIATVRQKILLPSLWQRRDVLHCTDATKRTRSEVMISVRFVLGLVRSETQAYRARGSIPRAWAARFGLVDLRFCGFMLVGAVFARCLHRSVLGRLAAT